MESSELGQSRGEVPAILFIATRNFPAYFFHLPYSQESRKVHKERREITEKRLIVIKIGVRIQLSVQILSHQGKKWAAGGLVKNRHDRENLIATIH